MNNKLSAEVGNEFKALMDAIDKDIQLKIKAFNLKHNVDTQFLGFAATQSKDDTIIGTYQFAFGNGCMNCALGILLEYAKWAKWNERCYYPIQFKILDDSSQS